MSARKKNTDAAESTDGVEEILTSEEDFDALALPENKYYSKIASVYSAVRYVLLVILVLFVSVSAIRNSDSITYDNLMFLMKDLGSVAESAGDNFETFSYNPDTTRSYAGFRKNLAVASSTGLTIYSGDGKPIFEGTDKYTDPIIETSDRYLLLYDFGKNGFSLFNSFARIYTETLDYEVFCADISDSGVFAVATRTKEYNSAVLIYTKNCKLKSRFLSEDRVIDVSVNKNGNRACVLAFDSENAAFKTKITILKPGESTPVASLTLSDTFPLSCRYTENGNLTVFCDRALYFYDGDGNLINSFSFSSVPETAELGKKGTVISVSGNAVTTESEITVFDQSGNILYSGKTDGKVVSVSYIDGYVFSLAGNRLTRTNITTSESVFAETSGNGKDMIVYTEKDVMICSGSRAEYYSFG
ncbi:MAG: DUF5711 family protein [Eubacteriales bacterium]